MRLLRSALLALALAAIVLPFGWMLLASLTPESRLFAGAEAPTCADAADVNNDGALNIADPIGVLNALFSDKAPPPPFEECGPDVGEPQDELGCESFPGCL